MNLGIPTTTNLANPTAAALAGDVATATAVYNEALTYLRLASDHAKFMRNYSDPTQERIFRQADQLAISLDQLRAQLGSLQEPVSPAAINAFVRQALPVIDQLIAFKRLVANLIRTCSTQHLLPADFIDHLRREAEFFLGIVSHVIGGATPTRAELHVSGPPEARVPTLARTLIDVAPFPEALAADLAYTEFWSKHHMEHADALTLFLRPEQQDLIQGAKQFKAEFTNLMAQAADVTAQPSVARISALDSDTTSVSTAWRNFLMQAEAAQRSCAVQTNFPQRLTEHIRIETDILLEAVARSSRRQMNNGAPVITAAVTAPGATFQSLTPKEILLS